MGNIRFYWRCARWIVRWVAVLYFKARVHHVHNVPTEGPVLLACNHQSFMDPILAAMAPPRESWFMARDTLFHHRGLGLALTSVNSFPVRRGSADVGAIKESLRRLKQGRSLVVFPEGTRSVDGRIGPMLPGMAAIAKKARCPIVPTLVDGMLQAWPRTAGFPRPGNVIVEHGTPILPDEFTDLAPDELADLIRRRLVAMQQRLHGRMPERRLEWYEPDT